MNSQIQDNQSGRSNGIGYYAMRLAITRTHFEEEQIKTEYAAKNLCYVVTETGGKSNQDFQDKIAKSVIGATLNQGVISKESTEIHALFHAVEEAKRGVLVNTTTDTNLALKIAIVRNANWIAVAMFGESAIHPLSSHERCGLGIMHI